MWANWRPSCGDCNNLKGTRRIVDPVRADPRHYVVFDLTTGAPVAVGKRRAKTIAEATRVLLDNQTLNEARRAARVRMVEALERLGAGGSGARDRVKVLLRPETPHRAVLRELLLEQDPTLNPYRSAVDAALNKAPELEDWAVDPRTTGNR